ncbi:MAG: TolC family protein [Planctomycetes bacterium]|nr:TolC family protein [Planctomycetota bacterium]
MKHTTILMCGIALATSCQSKPTDKTVTHFKLPAPSVSDSQAMPDSLFTLDENIDLQTEWQRTYAAALNANGDIIAAKARYNAALQKSQIVGSLPEPMLMLGGFIQPVETRNGPMDFKVGLSQRFPWQARLDSMTDQQRYAAQSLAAAVVDKQLRLRQQLTDMWAKRILLDRKISLTEAQLSVMRHIEDLVMAKFESGRASQSKVLRTQLATTKLEDKVFALMAAADLLDSKIYAASNFDVTQVDWSDQQYPLSGFTTRDFSGYTVRPRLLQIELQMQAAASAVKVANLASMPDFNVGVDYTMIGDGNPSMATSGDDAIGVQLSFALPFGNRPYEAIKMQAKQMQQSLRFKLLQATRNLDAEITNSLTLGDDAQRRVELYRDKLIPRAESTIEATLQAFTSNQASLQDVLDVSTLILEYKIQLETAHADVCSARAIVAGAILVNDE